MNKFFDKKYFQFIHPSNIMIDGTTGTGKTMLVRNIIKNYNQHFSNLKKDELKVLWCYGQFHDLIDVNISEKINIQYFEGIPTRKMIEDIKPDILVIDDLMRYMNKIEDFFTIIARHSKVTILFLVQDMFYHATSTNTIRTNCQYLIPMKFPQDKVRIKRVSKKFDPDFPNRLSEAYINATSTKFGYLKIDCTSQTPDYLRLQTNITCDEINGKFRPIVYLPKNVGESFEM